MSWVSNIALTPPGHTKRNIRATHLAKKHLQKLEILMKYQCSVWILLLVKTTSLRKYKVEKPSAFMRNERSCWLKKNDMITPPLSGIYCITLTKMRYKHCKNYMILQILVWHLGLTVLFKTALNISEGWFHDYFAHDPRSQMDIKLIIAPL